MERKIIHLDMDAFFASIEERDNPALRGKPVIVGARPGTRGVVSTCNYEARKYGLHSAMSIAEAYRRCPNGVYVRPHFEKYQEASEQVRAIMREYTDLTEFVSLDEGYMDVTGSEFLFGSAEQIALEVKQRVFETVGTTCSVGVGYSLMSAKLSSEEKKPDGFFVIHTPKEFKQLVYHRPVGVIYGIGKKTEARLNSFGIFQVSDLLQAPPSKLERLGSRMARELLLAAEGIDDRGVEPDAQAKSIGKETTFQTDISDMEILRETLRLLSRQVSSRLKTKKLWCRTVTLKVKYPDMKTVTRAHPVSLTNSTDELYHAACKLLESGVASRAVRLVGITASHLTESGYEQMSFASEEPHSGKEEKLEDVMFQLNQLYGKEILKTAKQIVFERRIQKELEDEEERKPG